ncbi:hypothetical protein M8C21_032921, partial [Ambrosia artemisiifolia]
YRHTFLFTNPIINPQNDFNSPTHSLDPHLTATPSLNQSISYQSLHYFKRQLILRMAEPQLQLAHEVGEPPAPVVELLVGAHPNAEVQEIEEIESVDSAKIRWLFNQAYDHEIRFSHQQEVMDDMTSQVDALIHEYHVTREMIKAFGREIRALNLFSMASLALSISCIMYRLYEIMYRR